MESRPYYERRNRQIAILIDRRHIPPKQVARLLDITHANLRKIRQRWRNCHKILNAEFVKGM